MCSAGRATPSCRGICEAVSRPTMRFAAIKSVEQQSALTLHRAREILVKQETMLANLIRGCLGEFGIVAPLEIRRIAELVGIIRDETDSRIPPHARIAMTAVAAGRWVYSPTSDSRRNSAGALCPPRRRYSVGQAAAGTSAGTRRHRCPRQQSGTHYLGVTCPR